MVWHSASGICRSVSWTTTRPNNASNVGNRDDAHVIHSQDLVNSRGAAMTAASAAVSATSDMKENPLFQQSQEIIRLSRAIIARHRTLEKETHCRSSVPPRDTWKRDAQEMAKLVRYGKQYGERLAESFLGPDETVPTTSTDTLGQGEMEELVGELFGKSRKSAEAQGTWGQVAHAQVRALAGVVRTLAVAKK